MDDEQIISEVARLTVKKGGIPREDACQEMRLILLTHRRSRKRSEESQNPYYLKHRMKCLIREKDAEYRSYLLVSNERLDDLLRERKSILTPSTELSDRYDLQHAERSLTPRQREIWRIFKQTDKAGQTGNYAEVAKILNKSRERVRVEMNEIMARLRRACERQLHSATVNAAKHAMVDTKLSSRG